MLKVRIVKNWAWPDLKRQTPRCTGIWNGIQFTTDPIHTCDYLIILNCPPEGERITVRCPAENVWALMQEPPNEWLKPMHKGIPQFSKIYNLDPDLRGERYICTQPALPWHVNRNYDELISCMPPEKSRSLSWVTSNLTEWAGHRARMAFLDKIRDNVHFDLYGRGFDPIEDKWDGLAPYRYSLAVENNVNPFYWSEKIADCFLTWTMPIYYGCTRITEYFPEEALVQIDINDPDSAEKIREAVASNRWLKNRDAIAHARELVLKKYQLFPFLTEEIGKEKYSFLSRVFRKKIEIDGYYFIPPAVNY